MNYLPPAVDFFLTEAGVADFSVLSDFSVLLLSVLLASVLPFDEAVLLPLLDPNSLAAKPGLDPLADLDDSDLLLEEEAAVVPSWSKKMTIIIRTSYV